jgi:hypothetical protein
VPAQCQLASSVNAVNGKTLKPVNLNYTRTGAVIIEYL